MSTFETAPPEDDVRLREYLGVLRTRKKSILAIALLTLLAGVAFAQLQTPIYRADARVQATNPLSLIQNLPNAIANVNMDTERALVTSSQVTRCAARIIDNPNGDPREMCALDAIGKGDVSVQLKRSLQVTVIENTTILVISNSSPRPQEAQTVANAFATAYVQLQTGKAIAYVEQLRNPLEEEQQALSERQADLQNQLADAFASGDTRQAAIINQQLNTVNNQLADVNAQLAEFSIARLVLPQVIAEATLPASPASPNKPLIATIALFIGLAFGIGLALLRERLDDRLRGRTDFEDRVRAPVLAVIPKVPGWRRGQDTKLISVEQPKSSMAEAYRTLRTSVLFNAVQQQLRTLMVVSPNAGEGKTTTAANLAVSLADANKRVILVSADLRKPRLHRFFGISNDIGLSTVLSGQGKPWEALQDPRIENLRVMVSGPVPARPAQLLQSEQMGELLTELQEVADFVIIDSPPVLLVADSLALTPFVDGVLFVADSENTSRGAVGQAREQLDQVAANVIGAVFNNYDPARASAYGYYGYGRRYAYYGYGATGDGADRAGTGPLASLRRRNP